MTDRFHDMLAHVTGGKRYCFVVMSFHEGDALIERIKSIITGETGLECISAEDIKGTSEDIREKVHYACILGACARGHGNGSASKPTRRKHREGWCVRVIRKNPTKRVTRVRDEVQGKRDVDLLVRPTEGSERGY